MRKSNSAFEAAMILYTFVVVIAAWGWVWNIIRVIDYMDQETDEIIVQLIVRVVGIPFPPFGAVIGFFPF